MALTSLDDIFAEDDAFGLLDITFRPGATVTPVEELEIDIVREVNDFHDLHGRLPDAKSTDIAEFRLGILWTKIDGRSAAVLSADRNDLLSRRPKHV